MLLLIPLLLLSRDLLGSQKLSCAQRAIVSIVQMSKRQNGASPRPYGFALQQLYSRMPSPWHLPVETLRSDEAPKPTKTQIYRSEMLQTATSQNVKRPNPLTLTSSPTFLKPNRLDETAPLRMLCGFRLLVLSKKMALGARALRTFEDVTLGT